MYQEKEFYTSGELAKLSGVSYKTIRHYVEKGLLSPMKIADNGYKIFGKEAVRDLQRILMLKYLDFPLEEIREMMRAGEEMVSLEKQEYLIREKIIHLNEALDALTAIRRSKSDEQWERMIGILQMTSRKEEIQRQYLQSKNLQQRINIHAYSTAKEDWFEWLFRKAELEEGMQVLDVGCGTAVLWEKMHDRIPYNTKIVLTDESQGMLDSAEENLRRFGEEFAQRGIQFVYQRMNACEISMDSLFDRVLANHMLYHIPDPERPAVLKKLSGLLKADGKFVASTVGETNMSELYELLADFDDQAGAPGWIIEGFSLENGKNQLSPYFGKVRRYEQKNDLLVPDAEVVYNYVRSLPGAIGQMAEKKEQKLRKFLKEKISAENPFFIHKSTGVFVAEH